MRVNDNAHAVTVRVDIETEVVFRIYLADTEEVGAMVMIPFFMPDLLREGVAGNGTVEWHLYSTT